MRINQLERNFRIIVGYRFDEHRCAFAQYNAANDKVQFVNQAMCKQVIPQDSTSKNDNLFAWFAFKFGDFVIHIFTANDGGGILPDSSVSRAETVRYCHFFYFVVKT